MGVKRTSATPQSMPMSKRRALLPSKSDVDLRGRADGVGVGGEEWKVPRGGNIPRTVR